MIFSALSLGCVASVGAFAETIYLGGGNGLTIIDGRTFTQTQALPGRIITALTAVSGDQILLVGSTRPETGTFLLSAVDTDSNDEVASISLPGPAAAVAFNAPTGTATVVTTPQCSACPGQSAIIRARLHPLEVIDQVGLSPADSPPFFDSVEATATEFTLLGAGGTIVALYPPTMERTVVSRTPCCVENWTVDSTGERALILHSESGLLTVRIQQVPFLRDLGAVRFEGTLGFVAAGPGSDAFAAVGADCSTDGCSSTLTRISLGNDRPENVADLGILLGFLDVRVSEERAYVLAPGTLAIVELDGGTVARTTAPNDASHLAVVDAPAPVHDQSHGCNILPPTRTQRLPLAVLVVALVLMFLRQWQAGALSRGRWRRHAWLLALLMVQSPMPALASPPSWGHPLIEASLAWMS